MIRIRGAVVIVQMTADTGVWRIDIITVMTCGTIVGYGSMGPVQGIIIIMIGKCGRIPVRIGRMTASTIYGKTQGVVIGIDRLIIISGMTGSTIRWGSCIALRVTFDAFCGRMAPSQREIGQIVIEVIFCTPGGVTGQTGLIIIGVSTDPCMMTIRFGIGMTGSAGENRII